uniref:Uncharacterized protein n=1 Tax=Panagrolaimus sp. JU765 TaxID=591449 RepID=A0AC34RD38_9BILA
MQATDISWCGYGVVRAVFGALKLLSQLNQPWKYFQYLSGFDLPLKTNLELVRIFKQLDGAFISEVTALQKDRISVTNETSPVPLFKSSLSATFSRASADFIVESEVVRDLLSFLKNTRCPDESLWTTMAGNPQILPMPGAFDGKKFLQFRKKDSRLPTYKRIKAQQNRTKRGPGERFVPSQYYISRYQIWSPNKACKGKYKSGSCVFGVADLPNLVKRAELVAHKLYLDFQPAAYFCLLKNHWNRALNARNQRKFSAKPYSEIAHVELLHGKPFEDLWFYR